MDIFLKPGEQIAIEKSIKEIQKQYSEGENNVLKRNDAESRYLEWSNELPVKYPFVRNFVCDLKSVTSGLKVICKEASINYHLSLTRDESKFLFEKKEGDQIYFCGKIEKESSITIWGGVKNPDIPVRGVLIADKKGKAFGEDFLMQNINGEKIKNDAKETNSNNFFLGERLLKLVPENPSVSPLPNAIQTLIPECKFIQNNSLEFIFSNSCKIDKISPTRSKNKEFITIQAITPHCCTVAIKVDQAQNDYEGGLDLFSKLSGATKSEVMCPDLQKNNNAMENITFYVISKNQKPMFVVREDLTGGGSGGNSRSTKIYFGKTVLDCDYIEKLEDEFNAIYLEINKNK